MNIKQRIEELRDTINGLVETGGSPEEVYKASAELDSLIKEYYKQNPA